MIKKFLLHLLDACSLLLIGAAAVVLLAVLFTGSGKAPSLLGYSAFRVMTGSMAPAIPTDALIVVRQTDPASLEVGDVISFYSRDPLLSGAVNTHRILAITQEGGQPVFTTKGDANNAADLYPVRADELVGEVVFVSPMLGRAVRLVANPLIFVPLVLVPLAGILLANLVHTARLASRLAREEEQAAVREAVEALRRKQQAADAAGAPPAEPGSQTRKTGT
jgi:signal peptidase I